MSAQHIVYKRAIIPVEYSMPKTYCDLPFQHQYVHMSGKIRLCCATLENLKDKNTVEYHMDKNSLHDVWNSDYMKNARLAMKNGDVLDACKKCIGQEERGYGSSRVDTLSLIHI